MNVTKLSLAVLSIFCAGHTASADVIVNEVMQSNVYCIMDDIKEFPDSWAELHNTGSASVSLDGYRIGLSKSFETAYALPAKSIAAGGYIMVYCDKVGDGMHTDFRIDSGKGNLYLFDPAGNIVDEVTMKKQPAPNVAYGRKTDAASKWGYQLTPSPGASNTSGISDVILGEVGFSTPGGVWNARTSMHVELSLPDNAPEGAKIIYTTDGSEPELGKASTITYSGRFTFRASRVVRAKAVCDGCISRPSNAQSYIFLEREMKIPVISIAINNEYLYDNNIGIFATGNGGWNNENYRHDWRRPINFEFFDAPETEATLNQLCETRVQGGYTRSNALKSMAVYANKRFGTKRFEYEFWAKDKPGVTDNKSIILRDGGNDYMWCYVRDGLMQRVIGRNTNIDWQGYTPAIVCINGKYHGMLAIRERSNEDNISANYNGLEDIDMFENWHELKSGDMTAHDTFMEFIQSEQAHTFDEWQQLINIESYTNLMALNYWVYNTDFPHNNVVFWRRRDGVDGRWQWLVKDCDFGLGIWNSESNLNKNFTDFLNTDNPDEDPTGYTLYRKIIKCPEYKEYFVNHLVAYMGDFLNATTFTEYLDEIWQENCGEQLISHDIWKYQSNAGWSNLQGNIDFMRNWIRKRGNNIPGLMRRSFGLGTAVDVRVNTELDSDVASGLHIKYANVPLTKGVFNGKDYVGRTISIEGAAEDNIVGWDVKIGGNVESYDGAKLSINIDKSATYVINARINPDGIADISADTEQPVRVYDDGHVSANGTFTIYDLSGRVISQGSSHAVLPAHGVYIIKSADGSATKINY